jgi:hypothetical protein
MLLVAAISVAALGSAAGAANATPAHHNVKSAAIITLDVRFKWTGEAPATMQWYLNKKDHTFKDSDGYDYGTWSKVGKSFQLVYDSNDCGTTYVGKDRRKVPGKWSATTATSARVGHNARSASGIG